MNTIKYILLDAANTLIHKPVLWKKLTDTFLEFGYEIDLEELKSKHKLLSEFIKFPDVTSQKFYNEFNKELVLSLGVNPTDQLLDAIFNNCKYLPWEAFYDTKYLSQLTTKPIGVLSNFSYKLPSILGNLLPEVSFSDFIVSETEKVAKPNIEFYKIAIKKLGLNPSEILYIGDSLKLDILPALEVGMNVKLIDRDNFYPSSPYSINSFKDLV